MCFHFNNNKFQLWFEVFNYNSVFFFLDSFQSLYIFTYCNVEAFQGFAFSFVQI